MDGKVTVEGERYWPIGSERDYAVMIELRAHADLLIHGRNSATSFRTVDSLAKRSFVDMRRRLGRTRELLYTVLSREPGKALMNALRNKNGIRPLLVTSDEAFIPADMGEVADVLRMGTRDIDLAMLSEYFASRGFRTALVEGGPNLVGSFFGEKLIDEVFLSVAPRVFGNENGRALTMVEGTLLPYSEKSQFRLLSAKRYGDEMFLRYRIRP